VAYPIQEAKTVLELFRHVTSTAPDELACDIVLITLPDGTPIVGMNICYNGPVAEGEKVVRPLRSAGSPVMDQVGPIPYTAAQQLLDPFYPSGHLAREADEDHERVKAAYGPEKYERLVVLKNKYDATNLFRLNRNIRPSQAAPTAISA
jgi:hypothetical protein